MAAPSPSTQTANAIRAINERANIPIPEIDFTVHELENGEIVRTDERVVKDVSEALLVEGLLFVAGSLIESIMLIANQQVQAPAMYLPTDEQFWSKEDPTKPDIAFLKNHFYREGRLTEEQALYILSKWVNPCFFR
jgi:serine/threonine-protein phosphatase 2B catalytic subunit